MASDWAKKQLLAPEWPNIVLGRGVAEWAKQYLKQGSTLPMTGKHRTRSCEDKQGGKHLMIHKVLIY